MPLNNFHIKKNYIQVLIPAGAIATMLHCIHVNCFLSQHDLSCSLTEGFC